MIVLTTLLLFAQATGTITGTVNDALSHRPIPLAQVEDVKTGDDGSYTLATPVTAGEVHVRVAATGYMPLQATARLDAGGFVKLDIDLHPLARITGKLVDKETGEPIMASLLLSPQPKMGMATNGAFEINDIEPGDYTLQVRELIGLFGIAKTPRVHGDYTYPGTIHLEEGQQQFLDIRLPWIESHRIAGSIEMPAGRESDAVTIEIHRQNFVSSIWIPGKYPGPFSIGGLTPGEYKFVAKMGRGAEALYGDLSLVVTDHDLENVKLMLLPTASLTATVRMAEDGGDVPDDVELALYAAGTTRPPDPVSLHDGRFSIEGLAPGKYWPKLNHLPAGYAQLLSEPVALYGAVEVTLLLTSKPGVILGTVRDGNQAPVKNAPVSLVPDLPDVSPRMTIRTQSGASGEFRFANLAPGRYRVNGAPVEVSAVLTATVTVSPVSP